MKIFLLDSFQSCLQRSGKGHNDNRTLRNIDLNISQITTLVLSHNAYWLLSSAHFIRLGTHFTLSCGLSGFQVQRKQPNELQDSDCSSILIVCLRLCKYVNFFLSLVKGGL